ncbi:Trinucleotide Repeat-Containing 6C Protein [Manis pentadactyla]|nr:Trinucleotide Repeat-Containing 6C Protein [Manis pentadactyla]
MFSNTSKRGFVRATDELNFTLNAIVPGGILIGPASTNCVLSRVLRFALSQKGQFDQIPWSLAGSLYA